MSQFTTFQVKQAQFVKNAFFRDYKRWREIGGVKGAIDVLPPMFIHIGSTVGFGLLSNILYSLAGKDWEGVKAWIFKSNELSVIFAHINRTAALGAISYLYDTIGIPGAVSGFFSIRAFSIAERVMRSPKQAVKFIPAIGPAVYEGTFGREESSVYKFMRSTGRARPRAGPR